MERFVYQNQKKLRCGYTTGSCAAAAAKAAAWMLLSGGQAGAVTLLTPGGVPLTLPVLEPARGDGWARCAVKKDSGDDPDITNGVLVYATVRRQEGGAVTVDGGLGVGRVTKPGLDQPVGAAAINSVPRRMIREAVADVQEEFQDFGGLSVVLEVPAGAALAEKTLNPYLGIEGGISILGTSGIVEPMSERALVDTIRAECRVRKAAGDDFLLVTPGNYGADFLRDHFPSLPEPAVKCGNFIGDTIDIAVELGFSRLLLIGHIGKLCKVGAGILQTHSRYADGRMEALAACGLRAGVAPAVLCQVLDCVTTDAALEVLRANGVLEPTMAALTERIQFHLERRGGGKLEIGAAVFSNVYGLLGVTKPAEPWLEGWT